MVVKLNKHIFNFHNYGSDDMDFYIFFLLLVYIANYKPLDMVILYIF